MPKTIAAFEHLGEVFRKGQDVPDDHPLVTSAPHLFPPVPSPDPSPDPSVRIRGPLVVTPKKEK